MRLKFKQSKICYFTNKDGKQHLRQKHKRLSMLCIISSWRGWQALSTLRFQCWFARISKSCRSMYYMVRACSGEFQHRHNPNAICMRISTRQLKWEGNDIHGRRRMQSVAPLLYMTQKMKSPIILPKKNWQCFMAFFHPTISQQNIIPIT